jgi:hypothetical protein
LSLSQLRAALPPVVCPAYETARVDTVGFVNCKKKIKTTVTFAKEVFSGPGSTHK